MGSNTALLMKPVKHRAQVNAADASPAITEVWSDLSTATKNLFQKVEGRNPLLKLVFGGGGAKTATARIYLIDTVIDYENKDLSNTQILTWGDSFNIDTNITNIPLDDIKGSLMMVAVETIASNTTLDMYLMSDTKN